MRTKTIAMYLGCPLGRLLAAASGDGVVWLSYADDKSGSDGKKELEKLLGSVDFCGRSRQLEKLATELREYFAGKRENFTVGVNLLGTEFQKKVWQTLRAIPYGETISYQQLAENFGRPKAILAVGSANRSNHLVILVPCHRVINKGGRLGGYNSAVWRKRALLDIEKKLLSL